MAESISYEEAANGMRLTLDNAANLIQDAKTLATAGRQPRAIVLAVLAIEEMGKLPRLANVQRYEREGRMKQWRRLYRDHESKAGMEAYMRDVSAR